jgi:1-aminocyclopropane-1-carboxylate deaminase/D-cysteine desulfhydrase-like pyridoxal-dependent ACC family enzyme
LSQQAQRRIVYRQKAESPIQFRLPLADQNSAENEIPPLARAGATGTIVEVQQARDARISLDRIVVANSSGGTQAGLVIGKELAQTDLTIMGIDVDGDPETLLAMVQSIVKEGAMKLGLQQGIRVDTDELVRGYATPVMGCQIRE